MMIAYLFYLFSRVVSISLFYLYQIRGNFQFDFVGSVEILPIPWTWAILTLQSDHLIVRTFSMVWNHTTDLCPLSVNLWKMSQRTALLVAQQSFTVPPSVTLNRFVFSSVVYFHSSIFWGNWYTSTQGFGLL